jgi:DNA-binding winged helix-turn-helix (wHTH) protein
VLFTQSILVKEDKRNQLLKLDPIHHRLTVGTNTVELTRLNFALFARLYESANETVSIAVLSEDVWGNVTVTSDTVKQRIFLLRKALENANISGYQIQSVHGQGYRLIKAEKPSGDKRFKFTRGKKVLAVAMLALLFVVVIWLGNREADLPTNARVVFWDELRVVGRVANFEQWRQSWISVLSDNEQVQFVAIERDGSLDISKQARRARAALISKWTIYETGRDVRVRMQTIEPKTATVLRTDLASLKDSESMRNGIAQQESVITRILASNLLPLSGDVLLATDHPDWEDLRALSRDSETADADD